MKNNIKGSKKVLASLAVLLFFGISFASAFSVSYPYMKDSTLILSPNSATDLQFVLQNGGGATENINIRAQVLEGSEIINILDDSNIYTVVPGDKVPVNLRITLPKNATIGSDNNIKLEFTTVSLGESGAFSFGTGQDQSFKVVVGSEVAPKKNNSIYPYIILGILLMALIIVVILIKRRDSKPLKKK